jgi:hypothetical protein
VTRLLGAAAEYSRALGPIADDLLKEVFTFARALCVAFPEAKPEVVGCYERRQELIFRTIRLLEAAVGLDFTGRVPYAYNGVAWECPFPGGFTGPGGPKPHEVLTTLIGLHQAGGVKKFPQHRVMKAATYVGLHHGHAAAVDYVLDLIDYGYIPSVRAAARCLAYVLDRQAAADTANWARRRLPDIDVLESGISWAKAPLRGLVRTRLGNDELYRPQVLGRLAAIIEDARASTCAGEFIVNQMRLHGVASVVLELERPVNQQQAPLAVRAFMAQLDELHADTGAIVHNVASAPQGPSMFHVASMLVTLADHTHELGPRRQILSRLVVPRILGQVTSDGFGPLPPEWDMIPHQVIIPLTALARGDLANLRNRTRTSRVNENSAQADAVAPTFPESTVGLQPAPSGCDHVRQLSAAEEYPWNGGLRIQLARALLNSGHPDEAIEHAKTGIYLQPDEPGHWHVLADILDRDGASTEANQARNVARACER